MHLRTIALFAFVVSLSACASGNDRPRNANPASEMAPQGQDPGAIPGTSAERDCLFAVASQVGVDQSAVRLVDG
jgi:hypothetical protein